MARCGTVSRTTRETDIRATWDLDGSGAEIATGIGFFDHMLETLARHSGTGIQLACRGDLHVDGHHTTEDCGIVLGQCLRQALGDKRGIERFGHIACPLDEALVEATIDISGRGHLTYDLQPPTPSIGGWASELVPEFFAALAAQAAITVHLHQRCGRNAHHIVEAAFKAFARALRQAIRITGQDIPSTKGLL
ncbi:MAG: imidazoleglycerol-phosphate dehydratase HisB [Planctomycetota bacterium]|nr:imidazoleglycerol-phosphate dehydratase HisB [Planctomycetota bacterium]MDW8373698.1 imidazoleglycerol-phosphate dehydratase HisB [Planctomycetota bacterium]